MAYGNFESCFKLSEIFNITGRVLPVTLESESYCKIKKWKYYKGESKIPKEVRKQKVK